MSLIIKNPYVAKTHEYKGQIHFHSTGSDGVDSPTSIVTAYRDAGYDFVSLTDHNVVTTDPGVSGILFIKGVEESTSVHIGSFGATAHTSETVPQQMIDAINLDSGLATINHPSWTGTYWNDVLLLSVNNYNSIEIYNDIIRSLEPGSENSEVKWDLVLTAGHEVMGIAADDCHNKVGDNFNKGWIQVYSDSLNQVSIREALVNGNFYSTTGATFSISVAGNIITINTGSPAKIEFIGSGGEVFQTKLNAVSDDYTVVGNELYVRVRITRDSDNKMAWSNPLYVQEPLLLQDQIFITEDIKTNPITLALLDSIGIVEQIDLCGDNVWEKSVFGTFRFGERKFGKNVTICSLLRISEDLVFKFNGKWIKNLVDAITVTENSQTFFEAKRSLDDSISISETVVTNLNNIETLADSIGITESIANQTTIKLNDNITPFEDMLEIEYVEGKSIKSDWKFLVKNSSGQTIASLTNARKRWLVQRLNDETEAGFILDADDEKCDASILTMGVNELHIEYKGSLIWAGQLAVTKQIAKGNDIYWEVIAKDWAALLGKRFCGVESIREFTTTDAGTIAWTLISEAQALTYGNFGITLGTIEPSIVRSPSYDKKNILEAIKEMANAGQDGSASYGFDFEVTPEKEFNVYYPYRGTIRENVVFRYPGNCEDFEAQVDSWGIINQEWGLGQHWTGNTAIVSRADATSQALYKRREAIKNYRDVSVLQFLQDMVWQDIQWSKNPSTVIRFSSRVDAKSGILDYDVGDGVAVVCDKFDIDEWLWVYERRIDIGENDELKVTLTVGD